MRKKAKEVFGKKMARILVLVFFDIIAVALASLFALWIRFDFQTIPTNYLHTVTHFLPLDTVIIIAVFAITGLYTSVWRYASIPELISVIGACVGSDLIIFSYKHLLLLPTPRSFWFIFLAFLIFLTCGVRYSYRIGRAILHAIPNKNRSKNTMIVGGGDAAHILIDEIARNGAYEEYHISCIIDDNKQKQGARIRGIPIVGNRFMIKDAAEKYRIEQIIIAIPSAGKEEIAKIVTECQKTDAEIKILPAVVKSITEGEESITDRIRPIKYEDFLGRDEIVVNNDEIKDNLTGKTILVTGGGGSIGSELCRQIAAAKPKLLIIFDIYENNAYDIQQELYRNYPELNLQTIIGSVRDYDRLELVFQEFHPDQVTMPLHTNMCP